MRLTLATAWSDIRGGSREWGILDGGCSSGALGTGEVGVGGEPWHTTRGDERRAPIKLVCDVK